MNRQQNTILRAMGRKLAVAVLLAASAAGAYATLGDGKSGKSSVIPKSSLLTGRSLLKPGSFSLKSGYNFRGNQVITNTNTAKKVIRINTVATVQKGGNTFIVPLKKNIIFDKVKIDISNRQFQRKP